MENQDLRSWLARMEAAGELQHVSGAERMEEIGGIVDIYQRKMGRQALLFDDVPGYPRGYRVPSRVLLRVPGFTHWYSATQERAPAPLAIQ